jgi:D-alanine-D-alanine ligase-like ATP-grasp enzyme
MNVAVVMGGYSDESVISLRSGQLILNQIDNKKYTAYEVHILPEGWYCKIENLKYPINKADFTFDKDNLIIKFDVVILYLETQRGNLLLWVSAFCEMPCYLCHSRADSKARISKWQK